MKSKSYFAGSVEAAMNQARQELGPDAMLISTRKALPEARHLGEHELVFALSAEASSGPQPGSSIACQMEALKSQIEGIAMSLGRLTQTAPVSTLLGAPTLASVYSSLVGSEMYPELAQTILSGVRMRGENLSTDRIRQALREEVAVYCRTEPSPGSGARRIAAVVGPAGSGKTTTLVKLAVRFGLSQRVPTQLLTLDLERIAAADQLQTFASILDVGFQAVASPDMLPHALEEHRSKGLILIDTPGYGPKEREAALALAKVMPRENIEVHLVLPASMKAADLSATVDRFSEFRPSRLLFTRLDETRTFGCVLNELARTGLPVSFLANGQQIPEDLVLPSPSDLADLVLNGLCGRAASVAA